MQSNALTNEPRVCLGVLECEDRVVNMQLLMHILLTLVWLLNTGTNFSEFEIFAKFRTHEN